MMPGWKRLQIQTEQAIAFLFYEDKLQPLSCFS